jgi:hypothetical protein
MSSLERRGSEGLRRRWWPALVGLVVAWGCLSFSGDVRAAPLGAPALLVFELVHEVRHDAASVSLTNEVRQRVNDSAEFSLMSDNPSLVQAARAAGCEPTSLSPLALTETSDRDVDSACQARIGKRQNVERFVWGYLFEKQGQLYVKLHLWQQGRPEHTKVLPYREASRSLVADRLYRHLTQAGRVGDVRVMGAPGFEGGDLYVEGETKPLARLDASGAEVTLPLGPVALEVRAAGKVLARGRGQVTAGEPREIRLEPVAAPAALPPLSTSPVPPPPERSSWAVPVGWTALGVGVAALGFGVFANARVASLNDDFSSDASLTAYLAGVTRSQDACGAAEQGLLSSQPDASSPQAVRDHCSSLDTWKAVRTASYVGGGVLAVGGAALLVLAPSFSERSAKATPTRLRWGATPALGPSFAGASLRLSW